MSVPAPKIDKRTSADIAAEVRRLIKEYTAQWSGYEPDKDKAGTALIGIFARFAEVVIERLNQAPDKNFLAFLDLLGASPQPPQPARVPLTFVLSAGRTLGAAVPARTQVAASPAEGQSEPSVFETERPLFVTAARFTSLLTVDAEQDAYSDWSDRASGRAGEAFPVFQGNRRLEHVLYVGDGRLLGYPQLDALTLHIDLDKPVPDAEARQVQWECWDGTGWQAISPAEDSTGDMTSSGVIGFGTIGQPPESEVSSRSSRWLRCRLLTPVTLSTGPLAGMVRASRLPTIEKLEVEASWKRTVEDGLPPDMGFADAVQLDLTKDYLPFGERPAAQNAFYIASAEGFSRERVADSANPTALVILDVQLGNSHFQPAANSVRPSGDLELSWECWTGSAWQPMGNGRAPHWLNIIEIEAGPLRLTENSVKKAIVQGNIPKGAELSTQLAGVSASTVSLGMDGRFAVKGTLSTEVPNVFELRSTYKGRVEGAWVVVHDNPTVGLSVIEPVFPIQEKTVGLVTEVTDSTKVKKLRITNGRIREGNAWMSVSGLPGDKLTVQLENGRNELLIEALGEGDKLLTAVTFSAIRRAAAPEPDGTGFSDGTFGLCQSGQVILPLPENAARTTVNGQQGHWLRVRLAKGDYGKEAGYVLKDPVKPEDGFTLLPATFRPPVVARIRIGYEFQARAEPQFCVAYNNLSFREIPRLEGTREAFAPFGPVVEQKRKALYLGFEPPAGRYAFPNDSITLYAGIAEPKFGERAVPLSPEGSVLAGAAGSLVKHRFTLTNASSESEVFEVALFGYRWPTVLPSVGPIGVEAGASRDFEVWVTVPNDAKWGDSDHTMVRVVARSDRGIVYAADAVSAANVVPQEDRPTLSWQYWNGMRWAKLTVRDDSGGFTRRGLIEFVAPPDFAGYSLFGQERYWLRAQWEAGSYPQMPRLSQLPLNTTIASQSTSIVSQVLGSSSGGENQIFRVTRVPVLAGPELQVRESELPSAEERAALESEEGDDALQIIQDASGRPREIWVRWHEVTDFHASGPRDRHYVMDHLTGEIRFADGVNGRIPPRGASNIRLVRYGTGGGSAGNRPAGTVAQLKTTVPYVDKVFNSEAAAGGSDAEAIEDLRERMPRSLRHRDRAVTLEDFEDLARLGSSDVARARCVPLRDLAADLLGDPPRPGTLSVIVVPRTGDAKPVPTLELLARVTDFLAVRAPAAASFKAVGPLYVRVEITAEISLQPDVSASTVERAVQERLECFLHPLTGGVNGEGWDFGRAPHRSDFFAVIEAVPGVDHVRYLSLTEVEDQPGVRQTGRFLVYSGEHRISLVFQEK